MKKILACLCLQAVTLTDVFSQRLTPIMGWSSWNTYRVNISDTLIMKQANRKMKRTLFLLDADDMPVFVSTGDEDVPLSVCLFH